MKFSELWLRGWVNPAIDSDALANQITMAGLEVDGVEPVAGSFHGVVVGEVVECAQHPNADKLRVTKVNVGGDRLLDIVCGAPNCRQGLRVAVATIGAVLPGDFKIKAAKLRGEPSEGMLCSFSELGISDDHNGIIELPADAPIGTDIREYLKLDDNTIEISVTPNRADCLGIIGVARDVAVSNQLPLVEPEIVPVGATIDDTLPIAVEAPDACPRYLGRVVKGINVKAPTPLWMKKNCVVAGSVLSMQLLTSPTMCCSNWASQCTLSIKIALKAALWCGWRKRAKRWCCSTALKRSWMLTPWSSPTTTRRWRWAAYLVANTLA